MELIFIFLVGPKIREMSPSTKDKIREDVQDAMADKEEGNLQKWSNRIIDFSVEKIQSKNAKEKRLPDLLESLTKLRWFLK